MPQVPAPPLERLSSSLGGACHRSRSVTSRAPPACNRSGANNEIGKFSVGAGDTIALRFAFVHEGTYEPFTIHSTTVTFADFERVGNVYERLWVYNASSYILSARSNINIAHQRAARRYLARAQPGTPEAINPTSSR